MNEPNGSGPTDGTVDLNGAINTDHSAGDRWKPRTLKVKGQDFVVDSEEKAIELMQKGAAFERNSESVREEKRRLKAEQDEMLRRLQPLVDVDEMLRRDPAKAARVNAILQDRELPPAYPETDDPYQQQINATNARYDRLEKMLERGLGVVNSQVEGVTRNESLRRAEKEVKRVYPWATDDHMEDARAFATRHGTDLDTAFKAVTYDEIPERVRRSTFEEFGIDPAAMSPQRSEVPTLDGFGPMTPENLAKVYADPDLYARFKPAMRAHRQRVTGKLPISR